VQLKTCQKEHAEQEVEVYEYGDRDFIRLASKFKFSTRQQNYCDELRGRFISLPQLSSLIG
jgi:hypothetical protein